MVPDIILLPVLSFIIIKSNSQIKKVEKHLVFLNFLTEYKL